MNRFKWNTNTSIALKELYFFAFESKTIRRTVRPQTNDKRNATANAIYWENFYFPPFFPENSLGLDQTHRVEFIFNSLNFLSIETRKKYKKENFLFSQERGVDQLAPSVGDNWLSSFYSFHPHFLSSFSRPLQTWNGLTSLYCCFLNFQSLLAGNCLEFA